MSESDSEEEIDVTEEKYEGETYYVDDKTQNIVDEDGEKIGKWVNGAPVLD